MTTPAPTPDPTPAPSAAAPAPATPPTPSPAAVTATAPAKNFGKVPFTLQDNETVLIVARRHWVYLVVREAKHALFSIVPIAILLLVMNWTLGLDGLTGQVVLIGCAIWLVIFAVRGYLTWYQYQNDMWVVTNQRIVDSSKKHWFNHTLASADLDDVADTRVEKHGIFPTTFNYGNVSLQTAGQQGNFILSGVPAPSDILALIDKERDAAKIRLRGV